MDGKIAAIALTLIVAVPILLGYGMAFEEETYSSFESVNTTNVTDLINNYQEPIYNRYTGPANNQAIWADVYWAGVGYEKSIVSPKYGSVGDNPTSLPILAASSKTYEDVAPDSYTVITDTHFTWNSDGIFSLKVTHDGGTTNLLHPASGVNVFRYGSILMVGSDEYNVKTLEVRSVSIPAAAHDMTINVLTAGSKYGDPAYGWSPVPYVSGWTAVRDVYWMNGYENESVRMMASFSNNEGITITPVSSDGSVQSPGFYFNYSSSGGLTIDVDYGTADTSDDVTYTLGDYSKICIDIGTDSMRVSGLSAWPTMGADPQTYNAINLLYDTALNDISRILLDDISAVDLRVDSARVLTGYYPAIRDSNFSVGGYYPEQTVLVSFQSIAAYGDEFGWGGINYPVQDGALVSADEELNGLRIKDIVLMQEYVDGDSPYYNFYINNTLISNFEQGGLIWFGGDWSLVAKVSQMENVESTRLVWQAGEWAFNGVGSDFALIGLLTCGAVFVGLGMYGRRSGAKVGMLMLITGCAAFIFLAMI